MKVKELRNKSYSKVKEKMKIKTLQEKKLDTIENPQNNHTIADQDGSWTTPLKNCLGAMFQCGFKKGILYFGKSQHLDKPK